MNSIFGVLLQVDTLTGANDKKLREKIMHLK